MTLDQIKEEISNHYVGLLAYNKGFSMDKPKHDYGVDWTVRKYYTRTLPDGKNRYVPDTKQIDLQLKATTESGIIDEANQIKYDLEVKNYNDMVERKANGIIPLALILYVLPNDQSTWVELAADELRVR